MKFPDKRSALSLKQFLLSQYFYDGLKITVGVVFPAVILNFFGLPETGITISLGALYVSITDNPGPVQHKRNALMAANLLIFLVALLIGFTNHSVWLLAIEIPLLCFLLSMLTVYGARASSVGIAGLLVLIIGIDQQLTAQETLLHALFLLCGGVWYALFSQSLYQVIPYRPAEQTLGECMEKVSEYIRIKATFYDPDQDLEASQTRLLDQQVLVYQDIDSVRELIFKTRKLLKDSSERGNMLIMTFIDVIDLYEKATESHLDYTRMRSEYGHLPLIHRYRQLIEELARDLRYIAVCIHNHEDPDRGPRNEGLLYETKKELEALSAQGVNTLMLTKIWLNMRALSQRIKQIYSYQGQMPQVPQHRRKELEHFVTHQSFDWKIFRDNLSFRSTVFRHSLRVALVCLAAFLLARSLYTGHHSYWILLTIIVILKPGFSQTKKRNYGRILGTVAGGLLGIGILYVVHDQQVRFWLLVLFMLLCYSFIRIRYVLSVFFMTPFILILFSFIGHNDSIMLLRERIMDTFIGAGVAALASYFILPSWEASQIRNMMADMILRNLNYLKTALEYRADDFATHSAYRIARKEIYVSSSNLGSAFQRMLNEPKSKRLYVNEANRFILLNTVFSSCVAALSSRIQQQEMLSDTQVRDLRKIFHTMRGAYQAVSGKPCDLQDPVVHTVPDIVKEPDPLFIQMLQLSTDLRKLAAQVEPENTQKENYPGNKTS